MDKSKLLTILASFDKHKLLRVKKFLLSPYFNQRKDVISLYKIILRYYPQFDEPEFPKSEVIYEEVYKESFNQSKFNHLQSFLIKLIEKFIATEEFFAREFNQDLSLMQYYGHNGLNKYFYQVRKKIEDNLNPTQTKFINISLLFDYLQFHNFQSPYYEKNAMYEGDMGVLGQLKAIDDYYLSFKLELACSIMNLKITTGRHQAIPFIEEVIDYLQQVDHDKINVHAKLYYKIYKLLCNPNNEELTLELQGDIVANKDIIDIENLRKLGSYFENICALNIAMGNTKYYHILFNHYDFFFNKINSEVLPFILATTFKNACTVAIRIKEYNWVSSLLLTHKHKLLPAEAKDVISYNKANLAFELGKYDEAIKTIRDLNFTNIFFNIDARRLLIKTYYEKKEWLAIDASINAFKIFIMRREIGAQSKANNLNFCKLVIRIKIQAMTPKRDRKIEKLLNIKSSIHKMAALADRLWLLDKCKDLEL